MINDPLYNHIVFGPEKGKGGNFGKSDEDLITDLINIHNAEKWLGIDGDIDLSMFKSILKNDDIDYDGGSPCHKGRYSTKVNDINVLLVLFIWTKHIFPSLYLCRM